MNSARPGIGEIINIAINYHYAQRGRLESEPRADSIRGKERQANLAIVKFKKQKRRLRTRNYRSNCHRFKDYIDYIYHAFYQDPVLVERKSEVADNQFRRLVLDSYNGFSEHFRYTGGWCVVNGCWMNHIKGTCIVPSIYSAEIVDYIFGCGFGSCTNKAYNWLPLETGMKRHFENGNLVILPVSVDANDANKLWRVHLLNEGARNQKFTFYHEGKIEHGPLHLLDGRILSFCNDQRPMERFMFFRYLLSIMIHKMNHAITGAYEHFATEGSFWPLMGKYFHRSFLHAYAVALADANPERVGELMGRLKANDVPQSGMIDDPGQERGIVQDVIGIMEQNILETSIKEEQRGRYWREEDDYDDEDFDWDTAKPHEIYTEDELQAQDDQKNANFWADFNEDIIDDMVEFGTVVQHPRGITPVLVML